ncbi:hypothetical protein OTU49_007013, partial [Cherax quadricarinatus]
TSSSGVEGESGNSIRVAESPGGNTVTSGTIVSVASLPPIHGIHIGVPPTGRPNQATGSMHQQPSQHSLQRQHSSGTSGADVEGSMVRLSLSPSQPIGGARPKDGPSSRFIEGEEGESPSWE